jgi:dTDP-4-dehydrorhamnose reductase
MPNILMFGATGQLARCMIEQAAGAGVRLTALSRADVDLTDADAVRRAINAAVDCDLVVNAAAYTAVDQAESELDLAQQINAVSPGVMAQACADRDLGFIHVSTDYVFDGDKVGAYVETDPTNPQGAYGRTKLAGEAAVMAAHPRSVILRTSWVYSAFGKNFVKTMLRVGADRDELSVVADQFGCPTSAADIATAILTIARQVPLRPEQSGIFHFAGTGETSWAGFADKIFELAAEQIGNRPVVRQITSAEYPTPAKRPANSRLNSTRFADQFGYSAPAWPDSLAVVLDRLAESDGK